MMFMFAEDEGEEKTELSDGALDEVLEGDADEDDPLMAAAEVEEEGKEWT